MYVLMAFVVAMDALGARTEDGPRVPKIVLGVSVLCAALLYSYRIG